MQIAEIDLRLRFERWLPMKREETIFTKPVNLYYMLLGSTLALSLLGLIMVFFSLINLFIGFPRYDLRCRNSPVSFSADLTADGLGTFPTITSSMEIYCSFWCCDFSCSLGTGSTYWQEC